MNKILSIDVFDNGGVIMSSDSDGLKKTKQVDFGAVASYFSSYSYSRTPLLPRNSLIFGTSNGRAKIILEFDERVYNQVYSFGHVGDYFRTVSAEDLGKASDPITDKNLIEEYEDTGRRLFNMRSYLPKAIFAIDLINGEGGYSINWDACRLYFYFDMVLTSETQLYYYPFGNIYSDDHMCFGNISRSRFGYKPDDIRGLQSMYGIWLNAVSNTDLGFMVKNRRLFIDTMKELSDKVKPHNSIEELKSDVDKYADVINHMKSNMLEVSANFGLFSQGFMS